MPVVRDPNNLLGDVPDQPHLGLITDETGAAIAIVPGASMMIIEDPSRADKVFPVVLAKVAFKSGVPDYLLFICACGEIGCSRNYRFKCTTGGWHKAKRRPTAQHRSDDGEVNVQNAPSPSRAKP
jgi:hypothetical protein